MTKNLIKHFIYKVEVKKIINLFENENIDIRIVGGCIRDRLLNIDVHDIDFAVKCLPDKSINILKKQNIKFQDFGKTEIINLGNSRIHKIWDSLMMRSILIQNYSPFYLLVSHQ